MRHPQRWLDALADRPPELVTPVGLVGAFAVLNGTALWVFGLRITDGVEVWPGRPLFLITYTATVIGTALGALITWPLAASLLCIGSGLLLRRPLALARCLQVVGYAHGPLALYGLLMHLWLLWAPVGPVPPPLDESKFVQILASHPFTRFVAIARPAAYIAAGVALWILVRRVMKLNWVQAGVLTCLPAVVLALLHVIARHIF